MNIKKQMLKILILFISIVTLYSINSYCTVSGTKRMEITGGNPWVNIDVSHAYTECESLNSTTSTLGTNNLRAHLTTDADWSAMAIFSISQYGAATTNTPESTTGNESGVYNPGRNNTFTTGIFNTVEKDTYERTSGLFNADGKLKLYMRAWSKNRIENNAVWFNKKNGTDENGVGTYGWFGSRNIWGDYNSHPISIKSGLFGVTIGVDNGVGTTGWGYSTTTFRPVIWN